MEFKTKYLKQIERNPINRALDYRFIEEVVAEVLSRHFPNIKLIEGVRRETHKRRVGSEASTFIYSYFFRGHRIDGKPFKKHLIYSSHSDGSREHAYHIMRLLDELGFNDGDNRVIKPLEFNRSLQALIYEAVEGKNLLQYMKARADFNSLQSIIERAAHWLKKFHTFYIPENKRGEFTTFDYRNLNIDTNVFRDDVYRADREQGKKLDAFMNATDELQKRLRPNVKTGLVYGDFHPENIITDDPFAEGLTMIDLVDVSIGDQLRDIGSFIQQLIFMGKEVGQREAARKLRTIFLETYFDRTLKDLTTTEYQRINLYQSWNALRGFVWFFRQKDHRRESYGLLEDAWLYLTLALDHIQTFKISQE